MKNVEFNHLVSVISLIEIRGELQKQKCCSNLGPLVKLSLILRV